MQKMINYLVALALSLPVLAESTAKGDFPLKLPSSHLLLDLDANKGVTVGEGNLVEVWRNQVAGAAAVDFRYTDEGREVAGSGKPSLIKNSQEIAGHQSIRFNSDELINDNDSAFHGLITEKGYTWAVLIKPYEQVNPRGGAKYPNAFFGCLRNSAEPQNEDGMYAGFWGLFYKDGTVVMGSRNGEGPSVRHTGTPEVVGPILQKNAWHLVMGRQTAPADGEATVELYVESPVNAVQSKRFPTNTHEPSRMAIGTERNAINHQGAESFDGEIARFLIFQGAMDPEARQQVYAYLKKTYALERLTDAE